MLRRLAIASTVAVVAVPLAVTVTGCGSGSGQLAVSISSPDPNSQHSGKQYDVKDEQSYAHYKPGDKAKFSVKVVNKGPGSVTGVTIHLVLPQGFKYRSTSSITETGATRTQPLDAEVNSDTPLFGLWTLDQPGAAGRGKNGEVDVEFIADVQGQPGPVPVRAFAAGDATAGQTDAAPYMIGVDAAAKLTAVVNVGPSTAVHGNTVTYQVRLNNQGTGNAKNVAVLITLPPVLTFTNSVTPFGGNGTRNKGVDPIKNTLEVYYDGFLLPPLSNAGPGFVVIVFKAAIVATAAPGTYPVDVSVTDDDGDTVSLQSTAPLKVT
ncbi:MAG: hypothetical protein JF887_08655 [Candidatus Dormibacteraeota bacterium]|uniref:DUF11 domain-containing protein n=1 Tax=Candidatus Amunia macphersoniae TaxID=3127014 RepID=A0A934KMD1_9BACT|nr:hypothetical protein [Candidatus Dormibacteraeota bacterium]